MTGGGQTKTGKIAAQPQPRAAREQIIRDNFAQRGLTLTNLELVGVKTTRIP